MNQSRPQSIRRFRMPEPRSSSAQSRSQFAPNSRCGRCGRMAGPTKDYPLVRRRCKMWSRTLVVPVPGMRP